MGSMYDCCKNTPTHANDNQDLHMYIQTYILLPAVVFIIKLNSPMYLGCRLIVVVIDEVKYLALASNRTTVEELCKILPVSMQYELYFSPSLHPYTPDCAAYMHAAKFSLSVRINVLKRSRI